MPILVLGRLSPDTKLAGRLRLNADSARRAVEHFAQRLGLDLHAAALGIVAITNSNMARAIRVMTVERGLDPREFVLLPFGGAGPLHACELAEQLAMREVLVPLTPGVTSALGTLCVDIVHDLARSYIAPLSRVDAGQVEAIIRELEAQAREALTLDEIEGDRQRLERFLDLRYVGQVKTLTIPLPDDPQSGITGETLARARGEFFAEYGRRYHYVTDDIEVELSVIRVRGRGLQDRPAFPPCAEREEPRAVNHRRVHFREGGMDTAVFERDQLGPGISLAGPLIVEQMDSTTLVPPDWRLRVDTIGNLRLSRA